MKAAIISSLVVTVVVLLLCGFFERITDNPKISNCVKTQQDLIALLAGLEIFKNAKGYYPTSIDGINSLVKEKIFERLPKDPWGNNYFYSSPAKLNKKYSFDLYSFGENKNNNNGLEDDLVSWKNFDCGRYENSCFYIATVYFGIPVFFITLVIVNIKNITNAFTLTRRRDAAPRK